MLPKLKQVIMAIFFWCGGFQLILCTDAIGNEKKKILVLNSYHDGFHWTDQIMTGIGSIFNKNKEVELFVEYMDTKRHDEKTYFEYLKKIYHYKYLGSGIDIIISSDDHALDFLLQYRAELFSGVPIIYCGIDKINPKRVNGHKLLFGIAEDLDVKKNLEIALGFHPHTRTIAVVCDQSKSGQAMLKEARKIEYLFKNKVKFKYLTNLTNEELKEALKQLPYDSLVLLLLFIRDKNHNVLTIEESVELVGSSAKVPVYITWEMPLKKGIMGGYVASGFNQGKFAALTAKKILNGENANQVPADQIAPHTNLFNYMELKRFNISKSDLPQGSVIRNEPYSFYREYKRLVWGVISAFIALIFNIIRWL